MKFSTTIQSLALALTSTAPALAATGRPVHEFGPFFFVENLVVRPNGKLILTSFDGGRIYQLDPGAKQAAPTVVTQATNATGTTGITAIGHDKYAFMGCDNNLAEFRCNDGSVVIFTLDMTAAAPAAVPAARLPKAVLINGMASLPRLPHVLLAGDSRTGELVRVDTRRGEARVVLQSPLWLPSADPARISLGINGVRIRGRWLYWTNSGQGTFGRVPVSDRGDVVGPVETIATLAGAEQWDDFALAGNGDAYITVHPNRLLVVRANGSIEAVYGPGGSPALVEPTSTQFGKGGKVLYVTTGGDLSGQTTQGGQVVEITL